MASRDKNSDYVKKEMMLMIALITFVAGFLAGIIFSAFNSDSTAPMQQASSMPPQQQQMPQQQGMSPELARRIITLEKEVAANPQSAVSWANLGHVYFDTGKIQKAITAYNKSLQIQPNNPDVWTDLGVMYRRNKQFDEAIKAFDTSISQNPKHEQARFNKGIVLMYDKFDQDAAIAVWEELLSVNPSATAPNGQPLRQLIDDIKSQGK